MSNVNSKRILAAGMAILAIIILILGTRGDIVGKWHKEISSEQGIEYYVFRGDKTGISYNDGGSYIYDDYPFTYHLGKDTIEIVYGSSSSRIYPYHLQLDVVDIDGTLYQKVGVSAKTIVEFCFSGLLFIAAILLFIKTIKNKE